MGIGISGGMIVGAHGSEIDVPEDYEGDLWDWLEKRGMDSMTEHYDADESYTYYGFMVNDVAVFDIENGWLKDVESKAMEFKDLTGIDAKLIGCQSVW